MLTATLEGILLVNKPSGCTSFRLVSILRKTTHVKKIGHAGTLDPLATGVMVMLIGKNYTRQSAELICQDKEYRATIQLGVSTDTYDREGQVIDESPHVPTLDELEQALLNFQGTLLQTPPMFSAKKIAGQKLCDLARKGITIERQPTQVTMRTQLLSYNYPFVELHIACTKGTYIRTIAHDLGQFLGCGAHLHALTRTRSGNYRLEDCLDSTYLNDINLISNHIIQSAI